MTAQCRDIGVDGWEEPMSDQTYRWNPDTEIEKVWRVIRVQELHDDLVRDGVLVPDTRLQAIADAPRCEHGMIDEHRHVVGWNPDYNDNFGTVTCPGAPVLRALLDALGRTD